MSSPRAVSVPPARLDRWVQNFVERHGALSASAEARTHADDGSWFELRSAFGAGTVALGDATRGGLPLPDEWGVLIVRKGGFAIARVVAGTTVASKVGRRHVQGRTKAGGQSQQRFSRRRDNQARVAYEAAADHAARILGGMSGPLVTAGDQTAVHEVLADARLRSVVPALHFGDVPEPRRDTLDALLDRCRSWQVTVVNAEVDTPEAG